LVSLALKDDACAQGMFRRFPEDSPEDTQTILSPEQCSMWLKGEHITRQEGTHGNVRRIRDDEERLMELARACEPPSMAQREAIADTMEFSVGAGNGERRHTHVRRNDSQGRFLEGQGDANTPRPRSDVHDDTRRA
jgi:hypothetical protein